MNKAKYEVDLPSLSHGWCFRARRVQLGKTLCELAAESGVGINTLRRLEKGQRVALDTIRRLAPHLTLTTDQALAMASVQEHFMVEQGGIPPRTRILEDRR